MPRSLIPLLASVGLLLTGHGIQLTLLPLYAKQMGWSDDVISLTGACYFVGFMVGALQVPRLLSHAGFIRVFLSLAGLLAVVILSLNLLQDIYSWFALRFITGFCIAGIYVCSESWLNAAASFLTRGRILACYALTSLFGIGIGQTLVGLIDFQSLFLVCAILMLLALMPVGLFGHDEPVTPVFVATPISSLKAMPNFAISAIVFGGIMTGSIWTVAPLFAQAQNLSGFQISMMMNAIVFGGAVMQFPIGCLSDRYGRKPVLILTSVACLATLITLPFSLGNHALFLLCMGLFGGFSLTQFAQCSAFANEHTELTRVQVASLLLLLNGTGSVLGPMAVAAVSSYVASEFADFGLIIVSGGSMILLLMSALIFRDKSESLPSSIAKLTYIQPAAIVFKRAA